MRMVIKMVCVIDLNVLGSYFFEKQRGKKVVFEELVYVSTANYMTRCLVCLRPDNVIQLS